MKKLETGFEFTYYPGDHVTVATSEYKSDGSKFLERKYNEYINNNHVK